MSRQLLPPNSRSCLNKNYMQGLIDVNKHNNLDNRFDPWLPCRRAVDLEAMYCATLQERIENIAVRDKL